MSVRVADQDGNTVEKTADILPDRPSLAIERLANGSVKISWPSVHGGYALLVNESLDPAGWTKLTTNATTANGRDTVVIPGGASRAFWRLVTE